jgi:tRNA pseudouridine55 synthase
MKIMGPYHFEQGEILLVDKPVGWTSFDVVNFVRNAIRTLAGIRKLKIGHTGTLDPLASGLLILCTGSMTKRIEEFKAFDKEYTGTFTLGATTPSFDLEKEIDRVFPWEHVTEQAVREAASRLTGHQEQLPPVFSAVKIKGKRAYDYARREEKVEIRPKQVHISSFEILDIRFPEVDFRVNCSKGTYIRALARDFGQLLNTGAHLSALRRTRIGPYHLEQALDPETFKKTLAG